MQLFRLNIQNNNLQFLQIQNKFRNIENSENGNKSMLPCRRYFY